MDSFDFEQCHKVMLALDWEWWGQGTPSIETMKESARKKLEYAISGILDESNKVKPHEPFFASSGGFNGTAMKNRYGYVDFLRLEFVVTEWEANDD